MRCLLLGGGGPVGTALMYEIQQRGWTAVVADPCRPRHYSRHVERWGKALEHWIQQRFELADLEAALAASKFDLVLDLTPTLDKRRSIAICDAAGVSLVNSTMVDYKDDIHIAAYNFVDNRPEATRMPHIVASGMNPGALNAMAEEIILDHGQPDAIVFWEYDDTLPHDGVFPGPCTTWAIGESHDEITNDWNFEVVEEGTVLLHEDALSWDWQDFRRCGVPLDQVPIPPTADAFLIGHEECIYMGWRHDTAVKFVYGFHPENMKAIRAAGYDGKPTLLVHGPEHSLTGTDIVGVSCRYDDERHWQGRYCLLENTPEIPADTNATCILVARGVMASAILLGESRIKPGVHLTHELRGWVKAFRKLVTICEYELPEGVALAAETPSSQAAQ